MTSLTRLIKMEPMPKVYSIYEAKARLSELLRLVKDGKQVVVTERGRPIAKVVPFENEETFEERYQRFVESGIIIPAKSEKLPPVGKPRPGALERFLKDR